MEKQRLLTGALAPSLIPDASRWLQELGAEFHFSHEDLYRIEVCCEELVANLVNHAGPQYANGQVDLHARIEPQRVILTLIDPTAPFDPTKQAPPAIARSIEEMKIGGQGIHLVREFSDEQRYERSGNKNRMALTFNLTQPAMKPPPASTRPRGPDRRHAAAPPASWTSEGNQDRRTQRKRRSLGFISEIPIFKDIPYAAIEGLIERMVIQEIVNETTLLRAGELNEAVRIVLDGRLRVYLDQPGQGKAIEIAAGGCVGEMSLIDGEPVSTHVVADAGTSLLVMDATSFLAKALAIPGVAHNLMRTLTRRMRETNQQALDHMRKALEMEQAQRELQYARQIQASLLPAAPLLPSDQRLDCVGKMCPAREVGGDFYEIFHLDSDRVFFAIADVCGKGLPAALFMVRAIAILRAQAGIGGQPTDFIARLNEQLCSHNDAKQFLTAFCGILDLGSMTLHYVNAGHNPPLLATGANAFNYLEEPINPFVGMIEGITYRAGAISVEPGSVLVLYTDGVTEAENPEGAMLGEDRLQRRLNTESERKSEHLVDAVFAEVHAFAAGAPQSDDITVLAIRCTA